MWTSRRPGRACAPRPALFNVPDRRGVADRAGVPARPGGVWQAAPLADARAAGRRALRAANRLRLAASAARLPAPSSAIAFFVLAAATIRSGAWQSRYEAGSEPRAINPDLLRGCLGTAPA
jgi:hypothetical protein